MFSDNKKITADVFEKYAKSIVELFPSEIQTIYYTPRKNKKNPSGKLYDRYSNIRYQSKKLKVSEENKENNSLQNLDFVEDDIEYYTAFLLTNSDPCLWEKVKNYWQRTVKYRLNSFKSFDGSLNDILKQWPKYNDVKGYELINIDFENIHEGKGSLLLQNFDDFIDKILPIYNADIKDQFNRELLGQLQTPTQLSKDSRDYFIVILLHAILQPKRINKWHKPTILDAQEDFVLQVNKRYLFQDRNVNLRAGACIPQIHRNFLFIRTTAFE
ncbi:uncharacterized protein [Onthophagus taurus]|uniref:uncharacterized protein n=1 Tax=Onthophagus taurus TaxID=166361 RepID=UPI0039BE09DA